MSDAVELNLEYSTGERLVRFVVDETLYPLEALYGAAYLFIDKCFVFLERPEDKKVLVNLRTKKSAKEEDFFVLLGIIWAINIESDSNRIQYHMRRTTWYLIPHVANHIVTPHAAKYLVFIDQ